jgi:hypothetical protein
MYSVQPFPDQQATVLYTSGNRQTISCPAENMNGQGRPAMTPNSD